MPRTGQIQNKSEKLNYNPTSWCMKDHMIFSAARERPTATLHLGVNS